jgi:hypothetical protein
MRAYSPPGGRYAKSAFAGLTNDPFGVYVYSSKNKTDCETLFSCIVPFREWGTAGGKGQSVLVGGSLLLFMSCYHSKK